MLRPGIGRMPNGALQNDVEHGRLIKLVFFAHTPPPHHGQSYMALQILAALGGDARSGTTSNPVFACYHVNCRYSTDIEDIGSIRAQKVVLLLRYCLGAIWCRVRYGAGALFYIPAAPLRSAIYRDWL